VQPLSAPPAAPVARAAVPAPVAAPARTAPPPSAALPGAGTSVPLPVAASASISVFDGDWPSLAARLPVQGMPRQLAAQAELIQCDGDHFRLRVPTRALADSGNVERLRNGLSQHFGRPMRVSVEVGATAGPTAASREEQARAQRQKAAEEAIYADPTVRQMIDQLGAQIDPRSIRPPE
jgi:DNA polymerase-3 subunit gamma/tau